MFEGFPNSLRVFFTCMLLASFSIVTCPVTLSIINTHSFWYGLWEPLNTVCGVPAPSKKKLFMTTVKLTLVCGKINLNGAQ